MGSMLEERALTIILHFESMEFLSSALIMFFRLSDFVKDSGFIYNRYEKALGRISVIR